MTPHLLSTPDPREQASQDRLKVAHQEGYDLGYYQATQDCAAVIGVEGAELARRLRELREG